MAQGKRFGGLIGRFVGDRGGNFAVITGLTASVMAMGVGFGVNILQAYHLKSAMLTALDAAVTSTARDLTTGKVVEKDARALIQAFVQSNMPQSFDANGTLTLGEVVIDRTERTIQATLTSKVELAFPLFSETSPTVAVTSAAIYSDKKLEVAMMLDITGSMDGQKIRDLRSAATNAVDLILDGQDKNNPRSRVAIVPYSESVNAGALASVAVYDETTRAGADLPPPIDAPILASARGPIDSCATERKLANGSPDNGDDGPYTQRRDPQGKIYLARVNRDDRLGICPTARLTPLTADADALKRTIGSFRARGWTAGGVGAQWASYMLSPKWRGAIRDAGLGKGPEDFNSQKVSKVAILMTDGQFNTAYAGVAQNTAVVGIQGNRSRSNAEAICTNMKDNGIDVYTIGFDLNSPDMSAAERQQAKDVLKACASPDANNIRHYFEASTGSELDAAFKEIIRNAERLALTR